MLTVETVGMCNMCFKEKSCEKHKAGVVGCDQFARKIKTNRDRLRAMTDEELAKFFYDTDTDIPWCDECRGHHGEPNGCEKCMVDWLGQEAEEGE